MPDPAIVSGDWYVYSPRVLLHLDSLLAQVRDDAATRGDTETMRRCDEAMQIVDHQGERIAHA